MHTDKNCLTITNVEQQLDKYALGSDFLVQNVRVKVADRAASDSGEMSLLPRQICQWFGLFETFCLNCLQSWVSRIFSFSLISRECLRVGR